MKTLKNGIFLLMVLTTTSIIISSCSKEQETNNDITQNAKISSYLKSFYNQKTMHGTSVEASVKMMSSSTAKSEEFGDIVITEVFVGDDTRARGYVITSKETNVFLYFVDVDRVEYKMTSVDIVANQTLIFNDINELEKYSSTNELDFIKITQDLINQGGQDGTLSRIRYSLGACGNGVRGVYQAHYFLGIRVSSWEPAYDENGHQLTVPC